MAKSWKIILCVILWCLIPIVVFAQTQNYLFTNFTSGVLTRKLDARIDYQKSFDGARQLENVMVFPQGGVYKRGGSYYVDTVKNHSYKSRLVPFEYSTDDAYILEFGPNYIHVFKNNDMVESGGTAYEITTTYDESELFDLHFTQSADILYIAHPAHAPAKLSRAGDTSWTMTTINFDSPPSAELISYPAASVSSSLTTGSGVSFCADSAVFLAGDVGRQLISGTGKGIITGLISTSCVTVDITDDFSGTSTITQNNWYLRGTPTGTLNPSSNEPEGSICSISSSVTAFRATDVGNFIYMSGGMIEITTYTAANSIKGEIINVLDNTKATSTWRMEEPAWNSTNGYPATVDFFEERLCWAGTTSYPQTIWMSNSSDYENYATGDEDDDGITVTIASDKVNAIKWLKGMNVLCIGTSGSEWTLGAYTSTEPITPHNIRLKRQTFHGSSDIQAVPVGRNLLFVHRSGKIVREFGYDWQSDGYLSDDLTLLAEHLTSGTTIVQIAWQEEPGRVFWAVLSSGDLIGMTYLRDQQVWAWHKHTTGGEYESIAVIPQENRNDELWAIVARSISGVTKRYIEYFKDPEFDTMDNAFYVDCGLSSSESGATTFTGLDHLSGETVAILSGGVYSGTTVVSDAGSILVTQGSGTTRTVHAGLAYTATLETVDLPPGTGIIRRIPEITPRFYKTAQANYGTTTANLDTVDFGQSGTTPYTGNMELSLPSGWENDQTILMTSDEPLPFSVSGILVKYE